MQNSPQEPPTPGRFEVRLACGAEEIAAAQRLRRETFYGEKNITPPPEVVASGLESDRYDPFCDHLLVIERESEMVVGTYRLLRQEVAQANIGFYSQTEFDLSPLLQSVPNGLLEIGRACTHAKYRRREGAFLYMLLNGIADYVRTYGLTYLFGCGSFPGSDPGVHAEGLQYLHDYYRAPLALRACALPGEYAVPLDQGLPTRPFDSPPRLPRLIELYLSLGVGYVGDGAVIDPVMQTTDVFLIMPTDGLSDRSRNHFLGRSR